MKVTNIKKPVNTIAESVEGVTPSELKLFAHTPQEHQLLKQEIKLLQLSDPTTVSRIKRLD